MRKADRADAALLSSPFLSSVDERLALAGSLSHLLLALAEAGFARDHRAFESFRRHHWKVLTDGGRPEVGRLRILLKLLQTREF